MVRRMVRRIRCKQQTYHARDLRRGRCFDSTITIQKPVSFPRRATFTLAVLVGGACLRTRQQIESNRSGWLDAIPTPNVPTNWTRPPLTKLFEWKRGGKKKKREIENPITSWRTSRWTGIAGIVKSYGSVEVTVVENFTLRSFVDAFIYLLFPYFPSKGTHRLLILLVWRKFILEFRYFVGEFRRRQNTTRIRLP